jgi:hypothetical protein
VNLNPHDDNQVQHFIGGASACNAFGGLGQNYMLMDEMKNGSSEDVQLYFKAFEFVAFLHSGVPLSKAGWWVLTNLGK